MSKSSGAKRMRINGTLRERFEARVDRNGPYRWALKSRCWLWTGEISIDGYGKLWRADGSRMAHIISFELFVGPVPDGMTLDHECHTTNCVNPDHLTPKTCLENVRNGKTHNAVKTHCKRGHEFTPSNTRLYRGRRVCITCSKEYRHNYYLSAKENQG